MNSAIQPESALSMIHIVMILIGIPTADHPGVWAGDWDLEAGMEACIPIGIVPGDMEVGMIHSILTDGADTIHTTVAITEVSMEAITEEAMGPVSIAISVIVSSADKTLPDDREADPML